MMIRIAPYRHCFHVKIMLKRQNSELTKTHFERKRLNFPFSHVYNVISDVNSYEKFVPWCKSSKITTVNPNNNFNADLVIGYGPFEERYTSTVELSYNPDNVSKVKAISIQTHLLEFLETEWTITPANDKSSWVTFKIAFQFKSVVYRQVTDMFFKDIVQKMVQAFETRCKSLPVKELR